MACTPEAIRAAVRICSTVTPASRTPFSCPATQRRRAGNAQSRIDATSLSTWIQILESGLRVRSVPAIALDAGLRKCSSLVARPFLPHVASRTLTLGAAPRNPHRPAFAPLDEPGAGHPHRWGGILVAVHRPTATTAG